MYLSCHCRPQSTSVSFTISNRVINAFKQINFKSPILKVLFLWNNFQYL